MWSWFDSVTSIDNGTLPFDAGRYRWKATDYLASARDQSHAQEVNASAVSSVKLNKLSKR
jgi:hypothetical protein